MSDKPPQVPGDWGHVYGQWLWHDPVRIVGTRGALLAMAEALTEAACRGQSKSSNIYASDGEGFHVEVQRVDDFNTLDVEPNHYVGLNLDGTMRE